MIFIWCHLVCLFNKVLLFEELSHFAMVCFRYGLHKTEVRLSIDHCSLELKDAREKFIRLDLQALVD